MSEADALANIPPASPEPEPHNYVAPVKRVKNFGDMPLWEKSTTYYDIIGFINSVSQSIQGVRCTAEIEMSPIAIKLVEVFRKLKKLLAECPPIEQPQRFGNQAYRLWFNKLKDSALDILKTALPAEYHSALPEIHVYFVESFGNSTRIDYGTGHELAFIMFLCCLFKIGALAQSDQVAVGVKIFNSYLNFVRNLQLTYRMEPAGSHGVWSLDDYQFVPFIWGSAQLAANSPIQPHQFLEENIINEYKHDYMFVGCIEYINKVKTGHFAEHSNQLWSISAVQSWTKINSGLVKMYQKELLGKFPVIQHVLFGSLLEFKTVKPGTQLPSVRLGMMPPKPMPVIIPPEIL